MKKKVFLFAFSLALVLVVASLTSNSAQADTTHCGTIISNETWSNAGNVHIVTCDVIVSQGVTLTIEAGTIIKFNNGRRIIIEGTLRVLGIGADPVYFTSYRDDTIGGDTNGDGISNGVRGDWSGIRFTDTSDEVNSIIDHAIIRFGGDSASTNRSGAISLFGASPPVHNTTINQAEYCAIYADLFSFPDLDNNILEDNERNGFCLSGGTLGIDATWNITDTSYFLADNVTVFIGNTLTVEPGVIVKFASHKRLTIDGALRVLGTEIDPVYFTSYRDDSIGGDTNGDGASNCARGDWYDIRFTDTSDDANSIINNAIFRCGGDSSSVRSGAISFFRASPTVQNTTINEAEYCAIYADLFSFPTLDNNTLEDNDRNGFCLSGGTLDIDATWNITDTSYFLVDNVTVFIGNTLTVDPGVIVKLAGAKRLTIDGALRVLGTVTDPVHFTSYRDDLIGGDTNGDGASYGARGDWYDIRFTDTSNDVNSIIDFANFQFGGDIYSANRSGAISLFGASPTIQNTTINEAEYCAIYADLFSFPDLDNNTLENNDINGFCLSGGTLDIDATWNVTDTSYYIFNDITVFIGNTLTVNPGVIVKFASHKRLNIDGALRVLGTVTDPIYFTSYRDDSIGGDTNGDGASNCVKGDWYDIHFNDTSDDANSIIDHANFRCGGDSSSANRSGAISFFSASPTVQNTTINQAEYCAIYADLFSFPDLGNSTLENNDINGFCLSGGTLDIDATWNITDTSYYLFDNVTVFIGNTLTIDPGVIVKFALRKRLNIDGALRVLGTVTDPVYFTSYRDDLIGGDTNGDGASYGAIGDWYDLRFNDTSDDVNSIIEYATLQFGGDNTSTNRSGAISLFGVSPDIHHSTFIQNEYAGIYASESQSDLTCNNIHDNDNYGVLNTTPGYSINARYVWWGRTSGPYHPVTNPSGLGDPVSDDVDFDPWLIQPFTESCHPGTPGITVEPISGLETTEAGGTDTFTVVLDSQPTADVTIDLSSSDITEGQIDEPSLTFTSENWFTPQPVTVTGMPDDECDGDIPYNILTAPASSTDPKYDGLDADDVSVTNLDDDICPVTLWIEPPEATFPVSTTFTVDVMVAGITNLYGVEIDLSFDPSIVQVVDADPGTAGIQIQPEVCPSPDFVALNEVDNTTGTISYAATSLSPSPPCNGGGLVASITFQGSAAGISPVHFIHYLLSDPDLNAILVDNVQDGSLTVVPLGILDGTVDLQGRADESGAEVCAWQGGAVVNCTTTDVVGFYSLSLLAGTFDVTVEMARYLDAMKADVSVVAGDTTTLTQVKLLGGDCNDDCVINILDLSFMGFRFGSSVGDPNWDERADVNNDGTINILDIVGAGANFNETCPVPWP